MASPPNVNVAVCGKFHLLNYARWLYRAGVLNHFYFSQKFSARARFDLDPHRARNLPLKEYLTQAHGRILGTRLAEPMGKFYDRHWERAVLRNWAAAPLWHILAQGNCGDIIARAQGEGSRILAEVVNTHPANRLALLRQESDHWGVELGRAALFPREERLLEEVGRSDEVLAPSGIVEASYRARGIDLPFRRLPFAVDVRRFAVKRDPAKPSARPRIIAVGEIGLRKGQLRLLEALRRLGNPADVTLVGTIQPAIRPVLARYADAFRHYERVPHAQIPALMASHDIFVSASLEEGLALSICEATAVGLAVIATRESGAEEILTDGEDGILIDARDDEALSGALVTLIEAHRSGALAARDEIRPVPPVGDWASYAEKLVPIYHSLINGPAKARPPRGTKPGV